MKLLAQPIALDRYLSVAAVGTSRHPK